MPDAIARIFLAGGFVMWPIAAGSLLAWSIGLWALARSSRLRRELKEGNDVDPAPLEAALLLLGSLVVVLPLLGLLGTVAGIIDTFEVIREVGRGEPRLMARGIREALVATEAGLVTALPALILHHAVGARLKRIRDVDDALAFARRPR
jgi:biopolymer transport protein ExbB